MTVIIALCVQRANVSIILLHLLQRDEMKFHKLPSLIGMLLFWFHFSREKRSYGSSKNVQNVLCVLALILKNIIYVSIKVCTDEYSTGDILRQVRIKEIQVS